MAVYKNSSPITESFLEYFLHGLGFVPGSRNFSPINEGLMPEVRDEGLNNSPPVTIFYVSYLCPSHGPLVYGLYSGIRIYQLRITYHSPYFKPGPSTQPRKKGVRAQLRG